ncbi:MAG: hypothetical protein ACFB0B_14435 [Thermonemataceae bacterium]
MDIAIAFAKNLSLLVFIAALLFVYYSLPEMVSLEFNQFQQPINGLPKEYVFYIATFFVVLFNMILTFFVRFFQDIPLRRLNVPNQAFWLRDKISREHFFYVIQSWAYSFMLVVNLYTCYILYRLYNINLYQQQDSHLWIEIGIFGMIFLGWLSFLFFRFRIKKYHLLGPPEDELSSL